MTRKMSQIALPLAQRSAADPDRIVVGNANRTVIEALGDPAEWPFRTAILTGPPRSGKSLLGRWFVAQGKGDVIDGADQMGETDLFHRWNRAQEDGRPLLIISDAQPWEITLLCLGMIDCFAPYLMMREPSLILVVEMAHLPIWCRA